MVLNDVKDKHLLLLLENNIRGGIGTVLGDRYIESSVGTQPLYIDANNFYGWVMSQYFSTSEFEQITAAVYKA